MKTKRDLVLATGAQLLEKLLGYGILALFARLYDLSDMGTYFYAVALAEITCLVVQFGTNENLVRSVAAKPEQALDSLGEVVGLRLVVTAIAMAGLSAFFLLWKPETAHIAILAAAFMLIRNVYFAYAAFFVGMRHMVLRVATLIVSQSVMLGFAALAYAMDFSFTLILSIYVAVNLLLTIVSAGITHKTFGRVPLHLHPTRLRGVLGASVGLFATGVIGLLRFKVDTLMLGMIPVTGGQGTEVEVARYESAYKIFEASRFMVRPVILIYLPICAALYAQHKWHVLSRKLVRLYGVSFVGGLGMAGVVFLLAPWIILTVYGPRYDSSIAVLRVLMLTVPLMYAGFCGQFMANAMHLEKKVVLVSLVCLFANVITNAIVIPRFGALGAAWATLGTEGLAMAGVGVLVYRRLAHGQQLDDIAQADGPPTTNDTTVVGAP